MKQAQIEFLASVILANSLPDLAKIADVGFAGKVDWHYFVGHTPVAFDEARIRRACQIEACRRVAKWYETEITLVSSAGAAE